MRKTLPRRGIISIKIINRKKILLPQRGNISIKEKTLPRRGIISIRELSE
jgi:hypothetical protein